MYILNEDGLQNNKGIINQFERQKQMFPRGR